MGGPCPNRSGQFQIRCAVFLSSSCSVPLALSDDELAAVMSAAAPLPIRDRGEFLQALAVELEKHREIGPG